MSGLVRFGSTTPTLSVEHMSNLNNWESDLHKKDCFLSCQSVQMIAGPFRGLQGIFDKLIEVIDGKEKAIIFAKNIDQVAPDFHL